MWHPVGKALACLGEQTPRIDHNAFVAQQLPTRSGTVQGSCKSLAQMREKGAGTRRDDLWQRQPRRLRLTVFPRRAAFRRSHITEESPRAA